MQIYIVLFKTSKMLRKRSAITIRYVKERSVKDAEPRTLSPLVSEENGR